MELRAMPRYCLKKMSTKICYKTKGRKSNNNFRKVKKDDNIDASHSPLPL